MQIEQFERLYLGGTKMRQRIIWLLGMLILITCIFSGCGNQTAENLPVNPANPANPEEAALSVYVVKSDALYQKAANAFKQEAGESALTVTSFDSYESMQDKLNTELMAGGGPDVILYNSRQGQIDAQKLAQSGTFLPLDSYIEDLDPEVYPSVLMDAGHIEDKQYFVPFSYNLIYGFTTEQLMEDRGYSASDSLYEMITSEANTLASVSDRASNALIIKRLDPVNSFFDAAGVTLFDKNTGEIIVDKAEVEAICNFIKSVVYDEGEKRAALNKKSSSNDFAAAVRDFSFFTEDYSFMNNVRFYQSFFAATANSPMVALPYHKLNNPEELCASIVCFGGVNANTKVPDKAYALLQYILDFDVTNNFSKYEESHAYYAPVSLTVYQNALNELSSTNGIGTRVTIDPLSEENAQELSAFSQRITQATIPNMALGKSFGEIFDPYLLGKDSFDNCYKTFLNRLQIYVSE